jgi:hypothetical protein
MDTMEDLDKPKLNIYIIAAALTMRHNKKEKLKVYAVTL